MEEEVYTSSTIKENACQINSPWALHNHCVTATILKNETSPL